MLNGRPQRRPQPEFAAWTSSSLHFILVGTDRCCEGSTVHPPSRASIGGSSCGRQCTATDQVKWPRVGGVGRWRRLLVKRWGGRERPPVARGPLRALGAC